MDTVATTPPSPPPSLTRDADLIRALVASGFSLRSVVDRFNLTAAQLLEWLQDTTVKAHLEDLRKLNHLLADLQAGEARATALRTLSALANDEAAEPIERRRAAVALTRLCPTPPPRGRGQGEGLESSASLPPTESTGTDSPSAPPPQPSPAPDPTLTAAQVAHTILTLLQRPDDPAPNAGVEAAAAFTHNLGGLRRVAPGEDLEPLRGFDTFTLGPQQHHDPEFPNHAAFPATTTRTDPATGESATTRYTLSLHRFKAWCLTWVMVHRDPVARPP